MSDLTGLLTQRERKRFVDALAVATIVAIFVSTALPWFLHAVEINLPTVAWAAFVLALGYVSIAVIIDRLGSRAVVTAALYASPAVATIIAAVLWHLAGGIDQPALLIAFTIPVIAAALLPNRWASYAMAAFAAVVVAVTAMVESPAFGWYLSQMGVPVQPLTPLLPVVSRGIRLTEVPPAALFIWLQAFTISMFLVAGFCRAIIRFAAREATRALQTAADLQATFAGAALHAAPSSVVIVTADTGQVLDASATFFQRMLSRREQVVGRELLDVAGFDDPEAVEDLLSEGGRLEFALFRVGAEERLADIRAARYRHHDSEYCVITLHEWEGVGYLAAAENARDRALLIAGDDGRLRYGNRAAAEALGEIYVGRDVGSLLQAAHSGSVTIDSRRYDATVNELRAPVGTGGTFALITLVPRAAA